MNIQNIDELVLSSSDLKTFQHLKNTRYLNSIAPNSELVSEAFEIFKKFIDEDLDFDDCITDFRTYREGKTKNFENSWGYKTVGQNITIFYSIYFTLEFKLQNKFSKNGTNCFLHKMGPKRVRLDPNCIPETSEIEGSNQLESLFWKWISEE